MNAPEQIEVLIAAVTSAHRARDVDENIRYHPSWFDLDEDGRRRAFEATVSTRKLEAALDEDGLSTTAKAVLSRLHSDRRRP